MKHLSALAALSFLAVGASAQLTVQDNLSVASLSQLLEGLNVSIVNVSVNCAPGAMGHFSGSSELDIEEGLVLTSGGAQAVTGYFDDFASTVNGTGPDADLEFSLGGGMPTMDACALEFDCIPLGDTLLFNFSFGSEEYPEFVGSAFNDAFAIFLTGPGFPFPTNVAALPDGTPVAINNVNAGNNASYFHDNQAGQGMYVSYDGFTTNLTAFAVVSPEETYHFKVVIADVADMVFDSGVFLEAFSFRSVFGTTMGVADAASLCVQCTANGWQVGLPAGHSNEELIVSDLNGSAVKRMRINGERMTLDLDGLNAGVYIVRVAGDPSLAPVRVFKQ